MKFSIRNFIKKFSWKVEKERTNSNPLYEDLTAENNVKNNHYLEALEWSLNNEKIKNVALSGPYGSGKSSIINSFEQLYKKNYNFLNISLATFSDKQNDKQLEQSILQQIFYKVKEQEIPFSRFKRIKHIKIRTLFSNLIFLLLFFISLISLVLHK